MALNIVTIYGKLVKDAEVRNTSNGKTITPFCIAVQRNYKNAQGKYDADFIDCIAFEKVGDFVRNYFHKGDPIIVSGELQTNIYEDKNGAKHKSVFINVSKTYFAGGNKANETATQNTAPAEPSEPDGDLPY